jgi:pyruvate/2-oxoglutarate/acetoin dehydrogenase E1 component/TPP-dependent pyruvate/acetoin dehydrogenase alpha subunit
MDPLTTSEQQLADELSFEAFRQAVLKDYEIAFQSRQASLMGRKEVLTGKAKFGVFGDGKEVPQAALAKFFKPGDFYAGYYRDQTLAFATGIATVKEFFSQLYADPDTSHDPHSGGRQMNCHFASRFVREDGSFLDLSKTKNFAAALAPTAGHMPKALGLAYASKLVRNNPALHAVEGFYGTGNEVCFSTIGDASTSEGHFWETMNAAAVSQVPLVVFVWDDGYGISVPKELQTVKASISEALSGFEMSPTSNGIRIYRVKGWDYAQLCESFEEGIDFARAAQVPVLFHVEDLTQPQGHSTSGSHERYKSPERLRWEKEWDCIAKMRSWIIDNALASETELSLLEDQSRTYVNQCRLAAWSRYDTPIQQQKKEALSLITHVIAVAEPQTDLETGLETLRHIHDELAAQRVLFRKDIMQALHQVMMKLGNTDAAVPVRQLYEQLSTANRSFYHSHLYFNQIEKPAQELPALEFTEESPQVNGYEILNHYFDELFTANPLVVAFGEDLGRIGDVNQGFAGLQQKYGKERIFDTGIRELTIMGQGVGLSMRGLRPIAEIQYIDYLLYGLQVLSDDVSTLHYRSVGSQIAPMIVRTRGHRLEGIWHSGSPMGILVNALKGMHICVPRNMVQAVGFYNTLLDGKDPGIIVECLNGYRLKERLPSNLLEYKIPLGVPEIVREGSDITVVSYGSTLRIVLDAAEQLSAHGIDAEVVDVQTLLPFDVHHIIGASLKKTNRILFVDEDVPGGASSFMFAEVMDKQGGYRLLDAAPGILCSQAHRPGYGSDGDYFSKPNAEDVIDKIRLMMAE